MLEPIPLKDSASARLTRPPTKSIAGNANKYDSYREAWTRIALAQEHGFFLEAITIQESIISDRLISYLSRPTATKPLSKDKNGRYPSLHRLIELLQLEFPTGLSVGQYEDVIDAINQWRVVRNEAVHAIVKSKPGQPTEPVEAFLSKAKETAQEGEQLARAMCNWRKQAKKEEERMQ